MAHCPEGAYEQKDVLRAPAGLSGGEDRDKQYWRSYEEQEIAPPIENPERCFRRWLWP
jgi:hypothetical protein